MSDVEGTLHLRKLRTLLDYMKAAQRDFVALIRALWMPTFFLTLSCADTQWPEVLQTAYFHAHGRLATDEEVDDLSYIQRCELVNQDPILIVMCYHVRMLALFRELLGKMQAVGLVAHCAFIEKTIIEARYPAPPLDDVH